MGSEAGDPLRAHAFSNSEREGVMVMPSTSLHKQSNIHGFQLITPVNEPLGNWYTNFSSYSNCFSEIPVTFLSISLA